MTLTPELEAALAALDAADIAFHEASNADAVTFDIQIDHDNAVDDVIDAYRAAVSP
jgi:hypothetical protein